MEKRKIKYLHPPAVTWSSKCSCNRQLDLQVKLPIPNFRKRTNLWHWAATSCGSQRAEVTGASILVTETLTDTCWKGRGAGAPTMASHRVLSHVPQVSQRVTWGSQANNCRRRHHAMVISAAHRAFCDVIPMATPRRQRTPQSWRRESSVSTGLVNGRGMSAGF